MQARERELAVHGIGHARCMAGACVVHGILGLFLGPAGRASKFARARREKEVISWASRAPHSTGWWSRSADLKSMSRCASGGLTEMIL